MKVIFTKNTGAFLTGEPQWVLRCDRGAGPAVDGWTVLLNPLMGEKKIMFVGKIRSVILTANEQTHGKKYPLYRL